MCALNKFDVCATRYLPTRQKNVWTLGWGLTRKSALCPAPAGGAGPAGLPAPLSTSALCPGRASQKPFLRSTSN